MPSGDEERPAHDEWGEPIDTHGVEPDTDQHPYGDPPARMAPSLDHSAEALDEDPLDAEPTRIAPGSALPYQADEEPARLIVVAGSDRGLEYILGPRECSIGRGLDNDLVLTDIAVSRRHTLIDYQQADYIVRDLGSGNGTIVNGQRVRMHRLHDGDQISLGSTEMRFGRADQAVANLAEVATTVGRIGPVDTIPSPARRAAIPEGTTKQEAAFLSTVSVRPTPRAGSRFPPLPFGRRGKIILFGGGAVIAFLALLALAKHLIAPSEPQPRKPAVNPTELAAKFFDEARQQFRAKNWEEARRLYLRVYALAPGFQEAQRYAEQARVEIAAKEALERARRALQDRSFELARAELTSVPIGSAYASEVPLLKQRIDDAEVEQLITRAEQLATTGDRGGALAEITLARRIAPGSDVLTSLHEQYSEPIVAAPPPRRRRRARVRRPARRSVTKPRPPRAPVATVAGMTRRAMALYRQKQWNEAYELLQRHGDSLTGNKRRSTLRTAKGILQVGQAWDRARAVQIRDIDEAVGLYKKALKQDQRVGSGYHSNAIKGQLFKAASVRATTSIASEQYEAAYSAVRLATMHGPLDSRLKNVLATLDKRAMEVFRKGYALRDQDIDRARQLWQKVLRMVPSKSAAYQKAYTWLNNSAAQSEDEDEE